VGLSAVAFLDESDLTELAKDPEGVANIPCSEGEGIGLVDQRDERPGREETPVVLQRLPNDCHNARLPVPVSFSFEGIGGRRDSSGLAGFGLGRSVVGKGCRTQQAVNGVDSASPLGLAHSQFRVALLLKLCPSLY
jgi:hypothetical protein